MGESPITGPGSAAAYSRSAVNRSRAPGTVTRVQATRGNVSPLPSSPCDGDGGGSAGRSRLCANRGRSAGPAAAGAATILDLPESSSQTTAAIDQNTDPADFVNPDYVPFEHRGWMPMRRRVADALKRCDVAGGRFHAFTHCAENVHVYWEPNTREVDYRVERCHDRFCLPCGQIRSRRIARALEPKVREAPTLFITLTVRGLPSDSLAELLERLNEAWKALRRIPYWSEHVQGGAIMTEIKWSKTSGGHWHPHFHILAHGSNLDEDWLSQTWCLLTRGSNQVDIQPVREAEKALSYVTKYASKPLDGSFVFKPELLDEAIKTLKGRRLCACFGTWYGTPLNERPEDDDGEERVLTTWRYAGTTRDLGSRAEAGDDAAAFLLARVEQMRRRRLDDALRQRGANAHGPPSVNESPPDE